MSLPPQLSPLWDFQCALMLISVAPGEEERSNLQTFPNFSDHRTPPHTHSICFSWFRLSPTALAGLEHVIFQPQPWNPG